MYILNELRDEEGCERINVNGLVSSGTPQFVTSDREWCKEGRGMYDRCGISVLEIDFKCFFLL